MNLRLILAGILAIGLMAGAWKLWALSSELTTLRSEREQILTANKMLADRLIAQSEQHKRALDAVMAAQEAQDALEATSQRVVDRIRSQIATPLSPAGRIFIEGAQP